MAALLERPPRRSANAVRAELHGTDTWSQLNHYLLMVTVEISGPGFELDEVLSPEAEATIVGAYDLLQAWPPSEQG